MTLMELTQKQGDIVAAQRTLLDKAKNELRDFTQEEEAEFNNLGSQLKTVENLITAENAVLASEAKAERPAAQVYRPGAIDGTERSVNNRKQDDGGFESLGEMLFCVKNGDKRGRIQALSTTDAGVMIPPAFAEQIMMVQPEAEIVMPRSTQIPAGDPPDAEFVVPYFQQGDLGANGGVVLYWTAEGATMPDVNDPKLKDLTLKPQEVSGLATINNKTLQNWKASGAFVTGIMQQAWISGRDQKFIRGSGVGCPLGFLHTNFKGAVRIKRKTAGTVTYTDVAGMMGAMMPEALEGAMWIASQSDLPTLMTMKDDANNLIWVNGDISKGLPPTLAGIPVKFTGKVPVLGAEGDLSLVNLKYYLCKPGSGPFVALSEHVKFTSNKTVFRIVANIDGQPWVKDPLLLEDGKTQVSPFVVLK